MSKKSRDPRSGTGDRDSGAGRRALVAGLLVVAVAVAATVLLRSTGDYRVVVRAQNAAQLVKGNQVRVGGVPVGTVEDIRLTSDNRAAVELKVDDEDLTPLHAGTKAFVRISSLSSQAGRTVDLQPGPNSAPELPDGATIRETDVKPTVEIDQILNTLDLRTREALQQSINGFSDLFDDRRRAARAGLRAVSPAVQETDRTVRELSRDEGSLRRFLTDTGAVVEAVADRRTDLEGGLDATATTFSALAAEREALSDLLRRAPGALGQVEDSLGETRETLEVVTPIARRLQPTARALTPFIGQLSPFLRDAVPGLRQVRGLTGPLDRALLELPATSRTGVPAVKAARSALEDVLPILAGARPYVPDLLHGLFNGFGGTTGGFYDANGQYVRISPIASQFSLAGPLQPQVPLTGARPKNDRRCPGGALRADDGSSPWPGEPGTGCKPEQTPR